VVIAALCPEYFAIIQLVCRVLQLTLVFVVIGSASDVAVPAAHHIKKKKACVV
jgi:hypothetical protein